MTGKRFNPADRSTKAGAVVGALGVALGAVATSAPQVAQAILPIKPEASVWVAVAGILAGGLLGAKRGRG